MADLFPADPTPFKFWDHQTAAIEALRDGARAGHRAQVVMAPTGSGKSRIAAFLLHESNRKYRHAAFICDRNNLVDQFSDTLVEFGIPHGVTQGKHPRTDRHARIQVCSAQTIEKREFFPEMELMIVDEAHDMRKSITDAIKLRPKLRVIGLSATPFAKGMGDVYSNLINVCTTDELIESTVLAPLKIYAARSLDMTGAKVVAGEWAESEIEKRGMQIVGDIVTEWVAKTNQHFGRPVKTIVFSANVAHGAEICRNFNAAGYNFQQVSYDDGNADKRRDLIEEFRKPDSTITGLVACEVFTKGFDVPDILCGIAARPYRKSLSSHIQQLGRVMRSSPGKEYGLWLDHCGNVMRFAKDTAEIFAHGLRSLEEGKAHDSVVRKDPTEAEVKDIKCSCGFVLPPACKSCPACGKERAQRSLVETVSGVMEELGAGGKPLAGYLKDKSSVWRQLCCLAIERKPKDPDAARKFALAQFKNLYGCWPKQDFSTSNLEAPTTELKGKVQSLLIRRAHAVGRANAVR
ncbi:DEAD/DEAH box helicase family protein [Paraburkholderia fungorum]|uniref:DEAD/DEAH box helicase n=1 Tax=Paraburkholderia fungorum TaxID=134537 RepID=UPI0038BAB7A7